MLHVYNLGNKPDYSPSCLCQPVCFPHTETSEESTHRIELEHHNHPRGETIPAPLRLLLLLLLLPLSLLPASLPCAPHRRGRSTAGSKLTGSLRTRSLRTRTLFTGTVEGAYLEEVLLYRHPYGAV